MAGRIYNQQQALQMAAPQSVDDDVAAVSAVDAAGFNELLAILNVGATDTTVDMKLTECDESGGSYTDISGAAITQVTATGDNSLRAIALKLTGARKRYIKPVITVGDGSTGAMVACQGILGQYEGDAPDSAADAGFSELVKV